MRTSMLVIGLLIVLAGPARSQERKFTEADVQKAEEDLRTQAAGTLTVYIIDTPREPFLQAVVFDRIVLLAGRPFYRFRSAAGRQSYTLLDPSRIFAIAVEPERPK